MSANAPPTSMEPPRVATLDFSQNRLYYRSDAATAKLRIGILVDGPSVPAFAHRVLEDVLACNFAEIVCVVENTGVPPERRRRHRLLRALTDSGFRARLSYAAYLRWIDSRSRPEPSPSASVDCSGILQRASRLTVAPLRKGYSEFFPDDALEALQGFNLDVLLRFGFGILRGRVLRVPRYGIWSYHHGDSSRYRGAPPCLWELIEGHPLSGVVLQVLSEGLDQGLVIDCDYNADLFD